MLGRMSEELLFQNYLATLTAETLTLSDGGPEMFLVRDIESFSIVDEDKSWSYTEFRNLFGFGKFNIVRTLDLRLTLRGRSGEKRHKIFYRTSHVNKRMSDADREEISSNGAELRATREEFSTALARAIAASQK